MLATLTTNFLQPCNEDIPLNEIEEAIRRDKRKEHARSHSIDILPKKPHPFRSPMTYIRSSTLPRSKYAQKDPLHAKLSVSSSIGWGLDDEGTYPLSHRDNIGTTDNTPFTNLSNQTYYAKRQTFYGKPSKVKNSKYHQSVRTRYCNTLQADENANENGYCSYCGESLRRRASSLDFLPEFANKNCTQNGCANNKASPFARTASMSQRSPFRKKIAFADPETSMVGTKELRPKNLKRPKSGIDALFHAIERQEIDEVRKLITTTDININEQNEDKFTPLEFAIMTSEHEIVKLLLDNGAKENPEFYDPEVRAKHLETLITKADKNVHDFTSAVVNSVGDAKDNERQLQDWEWRLYLLKVMQTGFLSSDRPLEAPQIHVAALSSDSVEVTLSRSNESDDNKDIITRYEVEWSRSYDFLSIEGEQVISDKRQLTCTISGLEKGIRWHFRARAGNLKGFSPFGYPDQKSVLPSSWHDCDEIETSYNGYDEFSKILADLYAFQKEYLDKSSEGEASDDEPSSPQVQDIPRPLKQRSNGKKVIKKSISKCTNYIFNSAPKLLKKIKSRGIFLASLLYNENMSHVLVTMDENLPIVECDENYSKSFVQEFYWLSKASCTWEDVHHMLCFSSKSNSSQSVQIRRKLLQSALVLMTATGVTDLGTLHYKPFKDNHGSILLLAVNCIKKEHASRASPSMKWIPIQKLKKSSLTEQIVVPERLIPSVQIEVNNHRRSRLHLPRGLYLGYLKLRASVGSLSVIVPNSHTNILPFVKIQDVPNVTKDEWHWLKQIGRNEEDDSQDEEVLSLSVTIFAKRLKNAIEKLFSQLHIPTEYIPQHRIYDQEVIELNKDVIFILMCPSVTDICTPPNQDDQFTSLDAYSSLPVQAFELSNMMTYQPKLMSSYCRLSSILELETFCTQHSLRDTICEEHLDTMKRKLVRVNEFQASVDESWKKSRWVVDTIQHCQDKNLDFGIKLSLLLRKINSRLENNHLESYTSTPSESDSCGSSESSEIDIRLLKTESNSVLRIHGTNEIGLTESLCTEVKINNETTTSDIIQKAADQFLKTYVGSSDDTTVNENDEEKCNNCEVLSDLKKLGLVIVSGSRERCLRDDLNIMELQNPLEKGTLYLRLKKEALHSTKWNLTTSV